MNKRLITLSAIIGLAALSRLLPHPPNVTPIAAIGLFAGAQFRNRKAAFLLPMAAMFLSDLVLGFAVYGKRQGAAVPLFGGVGLVAISYFIGSALYMSLAGAGLVLGMLWLTKHYG